MQNEMLNVQTKTRFKFSKKVCNIAIFAEFPESSHLRAYTSQVKTLKLMLTHNSVIFKFLI